MSATSLFVAFIVLWIAGTIVVMVVRYRRDLRRYHAHQREMQERERRALAWMDALHVLWQDDTLRNDELQARAEAIILELEQCYQGKDDGVIADARDELAVALARRADA